MRVLKYAVSFVIILFSIRCQNESIEIEKQDVYQKRIDHIWRVNDLTLSYGCFIDFEVFQAYENLENLPLQSYLRPIELPQPKFQVHEEFGKGLVQSLQKRGLNKQERSIAIIHFVQQSIRYQPDLQGEFKYPIETLYQGYGDCEDLAILTCMLLQSNGSSSVLLVLDEDNHVAVGVPIEEFGFSEQEARANSLQVFEAEIDDRKMIYLYVETTDKDWKITNYYPLLSQTAEIIM
jgi:hypothetical protein